MTIYKDKAGEYLRRNKMHFSDINIQECVNIFHDEMGRGLEGKESSLRMIPTYIETDRDVEFGKPVIAIDAGGTNLRIAVITFNPETGPEITKFKKYQMPGFDKEISRNDFFNTIAGYLAPVIDDSEKIGFCFSYPTEIFPDRDGRLLRWSKEIKAGEVVGEMIGENLLSALYRLGFRKRKKIVLLNDTVATLLAGMAAATGRDYDSYIGFILGTGTNCSYIEQNEKIIKKKKELLPGKNQIINIESGAFGKAPGGIIDKEFDALTTDPGQYLFEKMISGGYIGPLSLFVIKKAAGDSLLSDSFRNRIGTLGSLSTVEMNDFLLNPFGSSPLASLCRACEPDDLVISYELCMQLVERAAKLTAVNISSVVLKSGKGEYAHKPVCITADGSTLYHLKSLKSNVEYYLKEFLVDRHNRHYEMVSIENATLTGAAIAGLLN